MAIDENKQKALAAALGQIEKQFGKGSIMRPVKTVPWMWKRSPPVRFSGYRAGRGRPANGPYRRDLRARILR